MCVQDPSALEEAVTNGGDDNGADDTHNAADLGPEAEMKKLRSQLGGFKLLSKVVSDTQVRDMAHILRWGAISSLRRSLL